MLKARYNFLAFLQAVIGVANLILTSLYFGISDQATGYLLSNSILASYFLLLMMVCEQFQYEYKRIFSENNKESKVFFSNYIVIGSAVGIIIYLISLLLGTELLKVMTPGLNEVNKNILISYSSILNFIIILYIPYQICLLKLVSENKLILTYIVCMIPGIFQLTGIFIHIYFHTGMSFIIKMILGGYIIAFGISILLSKFRIHDFNKKELQPVKNCIIESIKIKGIHNIHNYLTIIIINNFISSYSSERISIFLYLKKVSETIMQITYGPTHKLAINIFNEAILRNKLIKIILWRKKLDYLMPTILITTIILMNTTVIIISSYIEVFRDYNIFIIINLTLLMIQIIIMSIELPSAIINLCFKDFSVFLKANILYIMALWMLTTILEYQFGVYALSISLVFSQIINLIIVRKKSNKYLFKND